MAQEKTINISLTEAEFNSAIAAVITGPNRDLVTNCILFGILDTVSHDSRQKFFKATMGITPSTKFMKGEKVLIKADRVGDWAFDKAAMETEHVTKDGKLRALIVEVNPWKDHPYMLKYDYIHTDGTRKTDKYSVSEVSLEPAEEFPEEFEL